MSKQRIIALIIILAALGAGAYLLFSRGNLKSLNLEMFKLGSSTGNTNESLKPSEGASANLTEEYVSPDYGFSFKYPKGFNATELDDDSGDTVLVQKSASDPRADQRPTPLDQDLTGQVSGFQVYITPFDEAEPLTGARILQDLPPSEVIDPKDVLIGEGKAINAVIFLSTNPSFGKTREVWFIREGFLYQVTTYEGQDNLIGPILETFRFE